MTTNLDCECTNCQAMRNGADNPSIKAGESMPLKEHPLFDEVLAKMSRGELTFGCPTGNTGDQQWTPEKDDELRVALDYIATQQLRKPFHSSVPTRLDIKAGMKLTTDRAAAIKITTYDDPVIVKPKVT